MTHEDDFENSGRKYELNKKLKRTNDGDKRMKNPVSKGSIRTNEKKVLRKLIDNYDRNDNDDEDYEEEFY